MKIAIVDDDKDFIQKMREYIARWQTENNTPCTVQSFTNAVNFLEPYSADWDIVFLDIEMPLMNGLEAAKKLRKTDKSACLIFVTSMAQYAINGYEVDALDYVIKPVSYTLFCDKMQRAINYLKKFTKNKVFIRDKNGMFTLPVSELKYITKDKNYICYHTTMGELRERGTIADAEKKVPEMQFAKIAYGCLVNLAYVTSIRRDCVTVSDETLYISRPFEKKFVQQYMLYISNE